MKLGIQALGLIYQLLQLQNTYHYLENDLCEYDQLLSGHYNNKKGKKNIAKKGNFWLSSSYIQFMVWLLGIYFSTPTYDYTYYNIL